MPSMNIKKHIIIFTIIAGVFLSFFHGHSIAEIPDHDQCITCHQQSTVTTAVNAIKISESYFQKETRHVISQHGIKNNFQNLKETRGPPTIS